MIVLGRFSRTELLIGEDALGKLSKAKVAIFGIGGVGTYVAEGLTRAGVGNFILVDKDVVDETNINRQLVALTSTIGKNKVDVMAERMMDINPDVKIKKYKEFFLPNSSHDMFEDDIDYVVDAIDNVSAKLELIRVANEKGLKIISSMGAGNKLNPTQLEVADIYDTQICPLAKVIRREVKKMGVEKLKVVYSKEKPIKEFNDSNVCGSVSFVPSVAGLIIVSEVVKDLIKE